MWYKIPQSESALAGLENPFEQFNDLDGDFIIFPRRLLSAHFCCIFTTIHCYFMQNLDGNNKYIFSFLVCRIEEERERTNKIPHIYVHNYTEYCDILSQCFARFQYAFITYDCVINKIQ